MNIREYKSEYHVPLCVYDWKVLSVKNICYNRLHLSRRRYMLFCNIIILQSRLFFVLFLFTCALTILYDFTLDYKDMILLKEHNQDNQATGGS